MIKNNKVINEILLPKVLSFALIIAFTSGASIYVLQDKSQTNTPLAKNNKWLVYFIALLMLCVFADVYSDYKKTEKFSSLIVRKYLQKELEKHPELKIFEKVLANPQAIQNVSALIFNSLRPSERKRIVQIILEMRLYLRDYKKYGPEDTVSSKNIGTVVSDVRNQIVEIIQEHASVHPEFIGDIYSAMARADMIYIMPKKTIQQHTK